MSLDETHGTKEIEDDEEPKEGHGYEPETRSPPSPNPFNTLDVGRSSPADCRTSL
jgi:hypothetical protein